MKFMHLADVHLGADPDSDVLNNIDRGEEIWNTFRRTIEYAQKEGVKLILIAGDLFHRQPLTRELQKVDYLLSKVYTGKTVIIAGEHDYLKANSNYRNFEWNENVTMLWGLQDGKVLDKVYYPDWNLEVYGFSYYSREIPQAMYDGTCPDDNGRLHILMVHGGDGKHIPVSREFLNSRAFDYIALGHIHKPGLARTGRYAYSGCPEAVYRNDVGKRGCIICEIFQDADGESVIQPRFIPMAKRMIFHENITISKEVTSGSLLRAMGSRMQELGDDNIYIWTISGYRNAGMDYDLEKIRSLGNVLEVIDETRLAYDLNELLNGHQYDIVGMYIQSFLDGEKGHRTPEELDETERQALFLGIQAMLED